MNKRLRVAMVLCLCLAGGFVMVGCSGEYVVRRTGDGQIVITLVPSDGSGSGGGDETGMGGPAAPPDGGDTTPPPSSDYTTPPPSSSSGTPASVPGGQEALAELRDTYGITLAGYPTERDVKSALISARQFRPEDTKSLRISYTKENRNRGVMGVYTPGSGQQGRIEIYDHINLHTVFHEMTHHITLFPRNSRARKVAEQVAAMTPPEQGSLAEASPAYIPRSYARQNIYEYWAEFFSYLREKEKGIQGGYPCSGQFNPAESVRKVARQIYASN